MLKVATLLFCLILVSCQEIDISPDINKVSSKESSDTQFGRCEMPNIFFPNVFTPNGDGVNDCWMIRGEAIDEVDLIVYNRWGEKVWESKDKDACWDGTTSRNILQSGNYYFTVTIVCTEGEEMFHKGTITLLGADFSHPGPN